METAYRNYFVATFLKSCRHLASMKVNCHLLVLQAFPQERVVALSFDDLPAGALFFFFLFFFLFLWRSLRGAPSCAGPFDWCWMVVLLSADNVPMARAVQLWMTQCHLCQAFIFSTFCPTDTSLRRVSSICLSGSMLLFKWHIKLLSNSLYLSLPYPFSSLCHRDSRTELWDWLFLHMYNWVPHGHDFRAIKTC